MSSNTLGRIMSALLGGAVVLASASAALAADEGGMPQFNPKTFTSQIFWLIVCFGVLWLIMQKIALPAIGSTIESREARIQGDLDNAARARDEAKAVVAGYEKALAEARGKAQALAKETADAASAEASRRQQELSQRVAAEIATAERNIAAARATAMGNVKSMAAEVAHLVFGRLTGTTADANRVSSAVDVVLQGDRR